MEQTSTHRFRTTVSVFLSLAVIGGSIFGVTHRQQVMDWLALRNYEAPARISSIADETTMQDKMRRTFYANHPDLNDKAAFRTNCPSTEQSIVLGCYVERKGIFLLDVTDPRLNGVIQVTAAHEALHAAYQRLDKAERSRVDDMTSSYFSKVQDERIKKTVEQYRAKDPGVVPNELHSILGTEVRNLPPELESYYSQYFKDRSVIVGLSEKYEQTFVDLSNQVSQYDAQLKDIKAVIDSNQQAIKQKSAEIDSRRSTLDSLINSGKTAEYNAAVPGFNALVNQYNGLIQQTRSKINEYNAIVEKRNAIATTEQELVEAINSNVLPKTQ